jgi:hypothetical protein
MLEAFHSGLQMQSLGQQECSDDVKIKVGLSIRAPCMCMCESRVRPCPQDGDTPLMDALRGPHLEAVRLLIQERADVNTPDKVRQLEGLLSPGQE